MFINCQAFYDLYNHSKYIITIEAFSTQINRLCY